jgi:hypothetical protein
MKKVMSCLLALSGGACLLTGISAAVVSSLGHEELYFRYLGPLFVFLLGVLLLVGIVGNLTVTGRAEVVVFGRAGHKKRPGVYYTVCGTVVQVALLLMMKGVSLYVEHRHHVPDSRTEADAGTPGEGKGRGTE